MGRTDGGPAIRVPTLAPESVVERRRVREQGQGADAKQPQGFRRGVLKTGEQRSEQRDVDIARGVPHAVARYQVKDGQEEAARGAGRVSSELCDQVDARPVR